MHEMGGSLRGVRSVWPCAVRMLPQGWRVHNGGHSTRSLSARRWMPCSMPRERRRLYPQEDNARGKDHHGRRATPATVRGEPGGVRTLEAPGGVSPLYPRVPRVPPRDRIALAILRPLRDTVGHALPRLRQPVATAWGARLPTVWRGLTTGLPLKRGHEARLPLGFSRLY